jgi:hypothetical protein
LNAVVEILKRAQQEELPCLLVGGHAVILYQVPRFTRDIDFVVPDAATDRWLDFLQRLKYQVYHRTSAFIQLEPDTPGTMPPVDLMLVEEGTWAKLLAQAQERDAGEGMHLMVPHPWHLIAMKLTAANATTRRAGASDWSDIFDLLRTCKIDLGDSRVSKACRAIWRRGSATTDGARNAMSENAGNQWDIRLREAEDSLYPSHLRQPPSWSEFMHEMDAEWQRYMRDHDAPEDRLATKLYERFRIDS